MKRFLHFLKYCFFSALGLATLVFIVETTGIGKKFAEIPFEGVARKAFSAIPLVVLATCWQASAKYSAKAESGSPDSLENR